MDEVKKNRTEGSMWTVLKGRVYNISPYMKFHPGGMAITFAGRLSFLYLHKNVVTVSCNYYQ